jgi:integrase
MASVAKRKWLYQGVQREAWVVRYKDKTGAHRSRQFDKKKEADGYCRQVENEIEAGTHVARTQTITVRGLVEEYTLHLAEKLASKTIGKSTYVTDLGLLSYPVEALADRKLTDLTWQDIDDLARRLRKHISVKTKKPLATSTIREVLSTFKRALDFGIRRDYVSKNVVAIALPTIPIGANARIVSFTTEEVQRIIGACDALAVPDASRLRHIGRVATYLAAACGLRWGEIFALRLSDIDFENRVIRIRHGMTRADEMKGPKTKAGVRDVPLPSFVAAAIQEFLPLAVKEDRGLIFRSRNGGMIPAQNFHVYAWRPILEEAGFPSSDGEWRHFHALRHYAGSSWLDGGVPLADVSRLMGHANTSITAKVYMHSITATHLQASALERCTAALLPSPSRPSIAQELRNTA